MSSKLERSVASHTLFIRNLPYKLTSSSMYDLFGKYGLIRQVRVGTAKDTRGTAFVVYQREEEARVAQRALSGYNMQGRYLIVLPFQASKVVKK